MSVRARLFAPGSSGFIALLAALMTITAMSIDINLPAIPAAAADLGTSLTLSQLTVTVFFGGFAVGQALWGPLSDRTGRKPALLAGTVIYIASTIGCAVADGITTLLVMRTIEGFGAGAGSILARAVIRDLFAGPQMARIMSLALAAFVTAPIVAPSIGALILSVTSWRGIFWFLVAYGVVLFLLAVLFLEESLPRRRPDALRLARLAGGYRAVFGHRASLVPALVVVLAFCTLTIYLTNASSVFMSTYGLSAPAFGVLFAVVAAAQVAGNLANARLVRRLSLERVIAIGIAGGIAVSVLNLAVALVEPAVPWLLVPGFCGFFFCFGLIVANATALALQPHGAIVGAATSALGVAQTVVPSVVASVVAALYDGTAIPTLAAILLMFLAAGAVTALDRRRERRAASARDPRSP